VNALPLSHQKGEFFMVKSSLGVLGLLGLLSGFSSATQRTVTLITHDSFALDKALLAGFEAKENIKLSLIKGGDAGAMTNRLILTKQNPIADVVYGIDNTLLARALAADVLLAYRPKAANLLEKNVMLDSKWRISPVNYGYVALNYDIAWFAAKKLALPKTLEDFLKPEYKGLLVVQNPATSSPGLAFYLATIKSTGVVGSACQKRPQGGFGLGKRLLFGF
jgi:thiamine transport system substrate-binding protein